MTRSSSSYEEEVGRHGCAAKITFEVSTTPNTWTNCKELLKSPKGILVFCNPLPPKKKTHTKPKQKTMWDGKQYRYNRLETQNWRDNVEETKDNSIHLIHRVVISGTLLPAFWLIFKPRRIWL